MSGLLIVGASGHGKVVAEAALTAGHWERIAFADDRWREIQPWRGIPVTGPSWPSADLRANYPETIVAVGDAAIRLRLLAELEAMGYRLAAVIHSAAVVSPSAEIGKGSVIFAGAVINADAFLGVGCIINTRASVDHDCRLDDGVHVCPGAAIAGDVHIGKRSWIGIGVAVIQGISIGSDVTVGAGAAVIDDLADGVTAVGVPAQPLRPRPEP